MVNQETAMKESWELYSARYWDLSNSIMFRTLWMGISKNIVYFDWFLTHTYYFDCFHCLAILVLPFEIENKEDLRRVRLFVPFLKTC